MKVLHVVPSLEVGGVQRFVTDLLPQLANYCQVTLLVFKRVDMYNEKVLNEAGIDILSLNAAKYYDIRNVIPFLKIAKDFDVVHLHSTPSLYTAAIASIFYRMNLVFTMHTTNSRVRNKSYMRFFERWVYSKCRKIISISQGAQDALQNWLHDSGSKYKVIFNGINLSRYISQELGCCKEKVIVMVSRFDVSKDQKTLIRAAKYLPDDVIIKFVGDGVTLQECMELVQKSELDNKVYFLGSRNDVPQILSQAYLVVQSSNWEGFGLCVVEAMATGVPVIASNIVGLKEVVEGAGVLFEAGNEQDLVRQINTLLNSESIYKNIALCCKKRAEAFSISKTAEEYMDVYHSLQ